MLVFLVCYCEDSIIFQYVQILFSYGAINFSYFVASFAKNFYFCIADRH